METVSRHTAADYLLEVAPGSPSRRESDTSYGEFDMPTQAQTPGELAQVRADNRELLVG